MSLGWALALAVGYRTVLLRLRSLLLRVGTGCSFHTGLVRLGSSFPHLLVLLLTFRRYIHVARTTAALEVKDRSHFQTP